MKLTKTQLKRLIREAVGKKFQFAKIGLQLSLAIRQAFAI